MMKIAFWTSTMFNIIPAITDFQDSGLWPEEGFVIAGLQVGLSVELHILQIIASGINSAEKSFTSQDTTKKKKKKAFYWFIPLG